MSAIDNDRLKEIGDIELAKRSISGSWGQLVLIFVFVAFTNYRLVHPLFLGLCASIITLCSLTRFYLSMTQNRYFPYERRRWEKLFLPTIWVSVLAWAVLFFFVILGQGLENYTTTVALLIGSGMSAAIITSVAPNRKLGMLCISLVLGIAVIAVIMRMERKSTGIALIFITYYGFLSLQLKIHHRNFWRSAKQWRSLTEQRNRLQSVIDTIPGLVSWIGPDLKYRGTNRNYSETYLDTNVNLIGKTLPYKRRDPEFVDIVTQFVESPTEESKTELRLTIQGKSRWHLLVMRKSGGDETYLICIDIHDLKQARSELDDQRIRTELSSRLAALGEIAANLAHEIRNPISVIVTSAELIRRFEDKEKVDSLSDRILATCMRVNRMIDNLMAFSRSSEGEPYVTTSVHQTVRDSIDLVEHHFYTNHIQLLTEPIDRSLSIHGRPIELSQVLVNLLNNALDAAKKQEKKWVRLQVYPSGDDVVLSVTDSGPGIPEEVEMHLFTPFFTTKPVGKGTGLGLSISRQIIERHGGTMKLDNTAPHTTFVVRVPLTKPMKKSA